MSRRLIDLDNDIFKESRHWVRKNQGLKLSGNNGYYPSPRISSEVADCSMPMTFDHYSQCSLGCLYCFSYALKTNNSTASVTPLKPVNVRNLIKGLEGRASDNRNRLMYEHFFSRKFLLHWGGMADPFCNFEKANNDGFALLEALGGLNYPTLFSFKGRTIMDEKYLRLFQTYATQSNFAFQVSIVTGDDRLAAKVEMGVPSVKQRLNMIKVLSDMGYWTILRLRPFIIGVTDEGLDDLLHAALEAGINGISTEFFALDSRCNAGMRARYEWLGRLMGVDNLVKYFRDLSPSERGSNLRLNRLVKEPHIRKIYEFCAAYGLTLGISDPDFKELCTSGSCCAMPDSFPQNPLLQNWSTSQLTYHLKNLRKNYHLTGECGTLKFNEVFGTDATYLDSFELTNDHIAVTHMCAADRRIRTFRTILQEEWNNLRAPGNPRNYFHGKVIPVGLDTNGDLIFQYYPSDYEHRWKEEGILLTH